MAIRRIFFIALVHFLVMVCYPHYGTTGFAYGLMSFIVWAGGALLLSVIITILGMENWRRTNMLITLVLLIACAWFILNRFPQEDKVSPLKKLAYGDFPKTEDIKKGISAFGLGDAVKYVDETKENVHKIKDFEERVSKSLEGVND